ncbi:MAG: diaminopimelate decarboxylase, partial [Vampirovibrionales bacterium]|nr:diaminopimelate decarboxylase [Vampirovibrionales bacterium]
MMSHAALSDAIEGSISKSVAPSTFQQTPEPSVGGVALEELAKTYATPLYILDKATIRQQATSYLETLKTAYPGEAVVLYAAKANLNLALAKFVNDLGLAIDVVSSGELYTALQAGVSADWIYMNGNNKSDAELEMALDAGICRLMVDNEEELAQIDAIVRGRGLKEKPAVLLRVAPGIEAHTHDYLKTGTDSNKFGMPINRIPEIVGVCLTRYAETIDLAGLHAHIGSQIFDALPYQDLARIMLKTYGDLRERFNGLILRDLDLGGGLGICYQTSDDPPSIEEAIAQLARTVAETAQSIDYPLPRLLLEPGRSLVATAGITLYTVGTVKKTESGRVFVAVDGGMGDNIRPALYQADYSALAIVKSSQKTPEQQAEPGVQSARVTLVGKYCESGDVLLRDWQAPRLVAGDRVVIFGTGAYNYAMASTYNRIGRPAMVWV